MNNKVFEENQAKIKELFIKIANKDSLVPLANFQLLCKTLNLLPALISPANLKRHTDKLFKVPGRACLNFPQFEGLLKEICYTSFLSASPNDRAKLFFRHISEPSAAIFKISFVEISKKRHASNDFGTKNSEEVNNSVDLDFTIKEALETLKTKDESFRSSRSSYSREVSPVPNIKSRQDNKSSDLRKIASTNSIHRRPYLNKSVPDSPNTSIIANRPNARYAGKNLKDDELDEFLKTEKLVESELVPLKVNLQASANIKSMTSFDQRGLSGKKNFSVKKIEHSKSKHEIMIPKSQLNTFRSGNIETVPKKNIVVRLDNKEPSVKPTLSPRINPLSIKKVSGIDKNNLFELGNSLNGFKKKHNEIVQGKKIRKVNEAIVQKHKEYILKEREKLFSNRFVKNIIFSLWKIEWIKSKHH